MKIALLIVEAALLTHVGVSTHQAVNSEPNPEAASLYKWFDGLDYDLVRTGRFVRLTHKGWQTPGYAFVAGGSREPAKAVSISLEILTKGSDFATCEPANLQRFAEDEEKLLLQTGGDPNGIEGVTEAFVVARACDAKGFHQEAAELFRWADTHPDKVQGPFWALLGAGMRGSIRDSVAGSAMMQADAGFWEKHVDYSSQLASYKRITRLFGDSQVGAVANRWAETLSRLPPAPPDRDHNVEWLIKALPAVNAQQTSYPGRLDVFEYHAVGDESPALKLTQLGFKAVPKLIAAIADERPTLSGVPPQSLSVGDVALQTLEHIAGRSFGGGFPPIAREDRLVARDAVLEWWKNVQRAGEFEELCKEAADPNNSTAAIALAERYPSKSSPVVSRILLQQPLGYNHLYLIEALGQHTDPVAVSALKQAAASDRSKLCRVQAAMELEIVDRTLSERLLIQEWRRPPAKHTSNAPPAMDDDAFAQGQLIMALARFKTLQSLDCLTEGYSSKPEDDRGWLLFYMSGEARRDGTAYNKKLEAFLVRALDDNDDSNANRAASLLHEAFPSKYTSASSPFRFDMRRRRAELKNVWRSSQGLKPLPLPALPPPLPKPEADAFVESIHVLGNPAGCSDVITLAIAARSKAMSWRRIQTLFLTAAKMPLKGHKGVRVILSREAPDHGLTLLIALGFDSTPGSWPGIAYASTISLSNGDIGGGQGGIDLSNPGDFGVTEANLKRCLTAGSDRPFVIDCSIWPCATR